VAWNRGSRMDSNCLCPLSMSSGGRASAGLACWRGAAFGRLRVEWPAQVDPEIRDANPGRSSVLIDIDDRGLVHEMPDFRRQLELPGMRG
jgi:hypothetical protein